MTDGKSAKNPDHPLRGIERAAWLEHLAGNIAHEIIDPLSGINIYLGILEKICRKEGGKEDWEMVRKIVPRLQSASQRIEIVLKGIIDGARVREPNFVLTDINKPIGAAVKLARASLEKDAIKVKQKLAADLPLCYADPLLIKQAILNLIMNSSKTIKTSRKDPKMEIGSSLVNNTIVATISDPRSGDVSSLRNKAFDSSFVAKDGSPATGLGIVEMIIKNHGGHFEAYRNKWNGVEFRIQIPVEKAKDKAMKFFSRQ
jgi:nitrogen fixation/metabolism regulation signal transduction histidine kinase